MAKRKSSLFSSVLESLGFSRRKPQKRGKQRLLKLESLENRRLLTAVVALSQAYTINDNGNTTFVGGTATSTPKGDIVNFTITATNSGDSAASSVVIEEDLNGVATGTQELQGATLTGTPTASSNDKTLVVPAPTVNTANGDQVLTLESSAPNGFVLPAGDSVSISFSAYVNPGSIYCTVLNSVGSVNADGVTTNCHYYDGAQTQYMTPPQPIALNGAQPPYGTTPLINIDVGQTVASQPDKSGNVVYDVTVTNTNNAPAAATDVQVYDQSTTDLTINSWNIVGTLANGVSVSNASQSTPTPVTDSTPQSGDLEALVDLPIGGQVVFQVSATIVPGASQVVNYALTYGSNNCVDINPSQWVSSTTVTAPATPVGVSIVKSAFTDTPGNTVTPGGGQSAPGALYTITVTNEDTNTSDAAISGITLVDGLSSLPLSGVTWTATDTNPSDPGVIAGSDGVTTANTLDGSGTLDLSTANVDALTLFPGEQVTYSISGTVAADAEAVAGGKTLSNTAVMTLPSTYSDTLPDTATAQLDLTPSVGLSVTKTDSVGSNAVTPGSNVTYTIAISNSGPSDATKVNLTDALGTGSNGVSWSETSPGTLSGTGALNATIADLAAGATATFTEVTQIASNATPLSTTTDTASATSADITGSVSSSPVTVNIGEAAATVKVVLSDSSTTVVPGKSVTYTVTVSNEGLSDATSIQLTDAVDSAIDPSSVGWSTTPSGTITYGDSDTISTLAAGTTATLYLHANVLSSAAASLGLSSTINTVSVADTGETTLTLDSAASTLSKTLALTPQADLGITKADSLGGNSATGAIGQVTLGGPITYTITVTNTGPSDATNATVADVLPTAITGGTLVSATITGTGTSLLVSATPASISSLSDTVSLADGSSIQYVISGTISSSVTGNSFSNTATVSCALDTNSANNTAIDTDALPVDLSATNTDSTAGTATPGFAVPGQAITYTMAVSNAGPAIATGATVSDTLPSSLTGLKLVSVTAAGSATSGAKTGSITSTFNDTVNLPAGGSITYVLSGMIPSSATASLSSTATVSPPSKTPDSNPANNTATDSDTLTPQGTLSITESATAAGATTPGTALPGASVTYTIVASNAGPSDATGAAISDTFPAGFTVTSFKGKGTANASAALPSGFTATGGTNISDTVNMPAGTSITYTVVGTLNSSLPAGSLVNNASITPPSTFANQGTSTTASLTDTLVPTADLQMAVSDYLNGKLNGNSATGTIGNTPPGSNITYNITLSNAGPSDETSATLSDTLPTTMLTNTQLLSVNTAGGVISPLSATTSSPITTLSDTVYLPAGGSITYAISGTVATSATGTLTNTAKVTPSGVADPVPSHNSATDTDTLTKADLVVSFPMGQKTAVNGHDVVYQINVTNYGPGTAQGVVLTDTLPAGMTFVSATGSNPTAQPLVTTVNGNTVTITFGSSVGIAPASTSAETIVLDAMVSPSATTGSTLTNKVAVTTLTTQAQPNKTTPAPVNSATFATQVNTNGASLVPNPMTGKMDLVVTDGPATSNTVLIMPASGGYEVLVDGRLQGTFAANGRIVVYGDDNDYEWISPTVTLSAWLYGGSGTNYLYGGGGNDVIVGGPGTNYISGGGGSNLLIGGGGSNKPNFIMGTTGNNLEISGTTSYDANQAALNAILQEWDSGDSYSTRVQKITQTGLSVNGSTVVLNSTKIQRVAAYEYLYGGSGQNLYFATQTGSVLGRDYVLGSKSNETILPS